MHAIYSVEMSYTILYYVFYAGEAGSTTGASILTEALS